MQAENIQLNYVQGSSDKVYHAALIESKDGWLVNFGYGRRGKPLKTGTKTAQPIPYDQAKRAYNKLVTEKQAKGYTADSSGTPFQGSHTAPKRTRWLPQLLNPIEKEDLTEVLSRFRGEVALQTKHDGERRLIIYEDGKLFGGNRRGLTVDLHPTIQAAFERLISKHDLKDFVFDAEDMGKYVIIFDVLKYDNSSLTNLPFRDRVEVLHRLKYMPASCGIVGTLFFDLPSYYTQIQSIQNHAQSLELNNAEGVVLRNPRAPYEVGRPNSWGNCLKLKFYASATCMVGSVHLTKRSIGIEVLDGYAIYDIGNCTIPPNYDMPAEGDMVEIKYLYAYREGSLYQPQYKGVRLDKTSPDTIESLKYKDT